MSRLYILAAGMLLLSCGGKKQAGNENNTGADEKPSQHIPFTNILQEELRHIDTAGLPLAQYTRTGNNNEAGAPVTMEEIRLLATPFMEPDFNRENVRSNYTETSYADATTQTVVFNYEPKTPSSPVKKVYLSFAGQQAGALNLKWVSIQREAGDTLVKLYWKRGSYFLIGKSWPAPGGEPNESTTRVVWDGSFSVEEQHNAAQGQDTAAPVK